jgi:very-short-patch-repair endonuclease
VDKLREKSIQYLVDMVNYALDMDIAYSDTSDKIESPIETAFVEALFVWALMHHPGYVRSFRLKDDADCSGGNILVVPQAQVGAYRADFLICDGATMPDYWIAVECDRHAFHEKTKEQAQRDKARDRYFLNEGFPVVRFTGSEIYRDPIKCVDEVMCMFQTERYRRDTKDA